MSLMELVREQEGLGEAAGAVTTTAADGRPLASAAEAKDRLKRDLVERLGLSTVAAMCARPDLARTREELAVACRAIANGPSYQGLGAAEVVSLIDQAIDDVVGLGPIQPLLDEEGVTEVIVNGTHGIFCEREGRMEPTDRSFGTDEQILMVVDRILAPLGRRLDRSSPIVDARLPNGDRVNAVAPPVAIDGPMLTIRKFSSHVVTLSELVSLGSIPGWYARLLAWAVGLRQDIAVAGGTGSGKTTLLNALSCEIGQEERIVTIEDSAELRFLTHPDVVRLEARGASLEGTGEITIRDLVRNALRMRPDRIVVGEVRGGEAIDMLQAMNTGHDGSLTTLHSGTAEEAVLRLVLMARFGMDLPTQIIEEQIASALDLIVMSQRFPDGRRYVTSLTAVGRAQEGGVSLTPLVGFDQASRTWSLVAEPAFVGQAVETGQLAAGEVEAWRQSI